MEISIYTKRIELARISASQVQELNLSKFHNRLTFLYSTLIEMI